MPGRAWEPRTWHRYQYAFASPISYYDPYGLQVPPPKCEPGEICYTGTTGPYTLQSEPILALPVVPREFPIASMPTGANWCVKILEEYGIYISNQSEWRPDELITVLRAVIRMGIEMGGPQKMRLAIGRVPIVMIEGGGGYYDPLHHMIALGRDTLHQQPAFLGEVAVVHELAHAWGAWMGDVVDLMLGTLPEFVGEEPGPTCYGSGIPSIIPAPCSGSSRDEEWAESVAAYLYPEYIESLTDQAIRDRSFIEQERRWAPEPYQRPGLGERHRAYVELQFLFLRSR